MAQFNFKVNPNEEEKEYNNEVIPAGDYLVVIEEADIKPSKNDPTPEDPKTGILHLTMQIVDGPQKGKRIYEYLCIEFPHKKDVEAQARNKLNAICVAIDLGKDLDDTEELKMIPFALRLDVKVKKEDRNKPEDQQEKENVIKKHFSANDLDPNFNPQQEEKLQQQAPKQTKREWAK